MSSSSNRRRETHPDEVALASSKLSFQQQQITSAKATFYEQVRMVKFSFPFSGTILQDVPERPKGLEKSGWCLER